MIMSNATATVLHRVDRATYDEVSFLGIGSDLRILQPKRRTKKRKRVPITPYDTTPVALSTLSTSFLNASVFSSKNLTYSTARNNTPLLPFVPVFAAPPLPFGRPRVGISIAGAPSGASNAMSCAYPSRIVFRRFCSDMI